MRPDLKRLAASARDLVRPGGMERLKRRLEDRIFGAVIDATRLTNDGSYRRYRDAEPSLESQPSGEIPELSSSGASSGTSASGASHCSAPLTSDPARPDEAVTAPGAAPPPDGEGR